MGFQAWEGVARNNGGHLGGAYCVAGSTAARSTPEALGEPEPRTGSLIMACPVPTQRLHEDQGLT